MDSNHPHVTIAITGGGTGGHVYPALAVVSSLIERTKGEVSVVWIGSLRGMERRILENQPIEYLAVHSGKLRRYISLRNVVDLLRIVLGVAKSWYHLWRTSPVVLFAKGGYVSVPPVVAAKLLGIPIVAHESDIDPGLATRINGRFADRILISYEESRNFFADRLQNRIEVVGVPIRRDLAKSDADAGRNWICRGLGIDARDPDTKPVLLILGGSQGARRVNELIQRRIDRISADWIVVHQTGEAWVSERRDSYLPVKFLGPEYADVLAAAECIVSRAGATTLWEASHLAKAMVLIPLGLDASRGDQIRNAKYFENLGGAILLHPDDPDLEVAFDEVLHSLATNPEARRKLGNAANEIVFEDSRERVVETLISYIVEGEC